MKRLGLVFTLSILVLSVASVALGFSFNNIPPTTLQIAKDAQGLNNMLSQDTKTVRVGIGSSDFSSYVWNSASIYGTGEFRFI